MFGFIVGRVGRMDPFCVPAKFDRFDAAAHRPRLIVRRLEEIRTVTTQSDNQVQAIDADRHQNCLNCGQVLLGPYCVTCGQEDEDPEPSVKEFLVDVFDDFLAWDSHFGRTMRPLLARPGFLTVEYFAGHRAPYLPPARVYLIVSIIVFFVLLLGSDAFVESMSDPTQVAALMAQHGIDRAELFHRMGETFETVLPFVMALAIPLFAIAMKLFYIRSSHYYVDHLVFSFHLFSIMLIYLIVLAFLVLLSDVVLPLFGIGFLVYLWIALRKVYGGSIVMNSIKSIFLATVGVLLLMISFLISYVIAALLV
jgi:hypothetical protein